jgi:hypothetical protein
VGIKTEVNSILSPSGNLRSVGHARKKPTDRFVVVTLCGKGI